MIPSYRGYEIYLDDDCYFCISTPKRKYTHESYTGIMTIINILVQESTATTQMIYMHPRDVYFKVMDVYVDEDGAFRADGTKIVDDVFDNMRPWTPVLELECILILHEYNTMREKHKLELDELRSRWIELNGVHNVY